MTQILIVEDDALMSRMYQTIFTFEKFDVELAHDGLEALKKVFTVNPTLIMLDVMMPNMDGFTLAEEIRDVDPDIPLFFLSAKTMKEDIIQGYKLGADDYITKPFDS